MNSDFRERNRSRVRIQCIGLCSMLMLLGLASAHAGAITQYQVTGSSPYDNENYSYTATLNLQNDYMAGTSLADSNFLSFSFTESAGGNSVDVEINSPAELSGQIDPTNLAATAFTVSGDGVTFTDNGGQLDFTQLPSPSSCTNNCPISRQGARGYQPTLIWQDFPVLTATTPQGGSPEASEPGTFLLLLAALAALPVVRSKSFRKSRGATALR